ncbi:hypothetical protein FOL47_001025 [Perkinsus chesapeaki]|uniref:Cu/Pi carrier n=1 Tax=Perkinsus chesapeaki TaxID=330153 RepID=A0A7J6MKK8_PERCH|nr:hypothetical protein FOL47_001025 [Perkinsus chesapeaki]
MSTASAPATSTTAAATPAAAPAGKAPAQASNAARQQMSSADVLHKATQAAFRGGIAGASAQVVNVFALMWMRTTMNYQYRYGGKLGDVLKKLYQEGGVPRFYRGLVPALIQAPLSRFGDTAANVGVLALLDNTKATQNMPIGVKTAFASCGAACFRAFLMPIDAWKTTKQVEGEAGMKVLMNKVKTHGISNLWHGTLGAMAATWVGHYPWFVTHNTLNAHLPEFNFKVLKTTKQTSQVPLTYPQAVRDIVAKDGYRGLFGRGLATRILTNGLQGMFFSVMWKAFQETLDNRAKEKQRQQLLQSSKTA